MPSTPNACRKLTNYSYLVRKYCLAKDISGVTSAGSNVLPQLGSTPGALHALKEHTTLDQLAQTHPLSVRGIALGSVSSAHVMCSGCGLLAACKPAQSVSCYEGQLPNFLLRCRMPRCC